MSNITYEILYTPNIPIKQNPFEYTDGKGEFKIYFNPSVGNTIHDFNSGFIRIKNSNTEKNVLVESFVENVIPFINPFGKDYELASKLNVKLPRVEQDEFGYFITIKHSVFGQRLMSTTTDVKNMILNTKLVVQISLTRDIIAAGIVGQEEGKWAINDDDSGYGRLASYNKEKEEFEKITLTDYFKGNLLAKGISTWSAPSLLYVLTKVDYELVNSSSKALTNISSPITEFVGIKKEKNPSNNTILNLKKFKITIFDDESEFKDLIDSSDWISGNGITDLQIKWQNRKELVDKHNYLVRLSTCNNVDFIKNFDYHIKTAFQPSTFEGEIDLKSDYDLARNVVKIKMKSPLIWTPEKNMELTEKDKEDSVITIKDNEKINIENGISLIPKKGEFSAEFIMKGINPLNDWKEDGNYILRLQTPEPTIKNPYQTMYSLYALSMPTSFDINHNRNFNDFSPYEEDIVWNPILSSYDNANIHFKLFLDSSDSKYDSEYDEDTEINNRVLSLGMSETKTKANLDTLFVREYDLINHKFLDNSWWEIMIDKNGKVSVQKAPIGIDKKDIKPVYLYDPIKHLITEMGVAVTTDYKNVEKPRIFFDDKLRNFIPNRSKRPTYINEFRLVKQIIGLEAGVKKELIKQTYRSYLTGPNQKLMNWNLINPDRLYYFHINEKGGYVQLNVADITGDNKEKFDRYNTMNTDMELGLLSDQILNMRGLEGSTYMIQRYDDNRPKMFNLSVDSLGIPNVDPFYLSSITIEYEPLLEKDLGITNNDDKDDAIIDFDEVIIADIVVDDKPVIENYQFKCVSEEFYQIGLERLVDRIKRERYTDNDKIIIFDTDTHLQYNTFRTAGDIEKLLPVQTDSYNLLAELTYMLDIEAIILGGDLVDGSGLTVYDTKEAMKTIKNILDKRNKKTPYMFAIGNHDLNGFFARDSARSRKGNKKNGEPKPLKDIVMNPKDMVDILQDGPVKYEEDGYGYFIQNDIMYIALNTSESKYTVVQKDKKYYFKDNTFMSQGLSVKQLNWFANLLKTKGNTVKQIILCTHIPFAKSEKDILDYDYTKSGQYKVLNMLTLRKLVENYNIGARITTYSENDKGQAISPKDEQLPPGYAPIQLVLNGHCHTDEILNDSYANIFMSRNALNVKREKFDDLSRPDLQDGGMGYTYRFDGLSTERTSFKIIIFSEEKQKIKVLNFGYKQSKKLIDNYEFNFKTIKKE